MTFVQGFLWGSGLSLGLCVGLVAWSFLADRLSERTGRWDSQLKLQRESLDALRERNELTIETSQRLGRIADNLERLTPRS